MTLLLCTLGRIGYLKTKMKTQTMTKFSYNRLSYHNEGMDGITILSQRGVVLVDYGRAYVLCDNVILQESKTAPVSIPSYDSNQNCREEKNSI